MHSFRPRVVYRLPSRKVSTGSGTGLGIPRTEAVYDSYGLSYPATLAAFVPPVCLPTYSASTYLSRETLTSCLTGTQLRPFVQDSRGYMFSISNAYAFAVPRLVDTVTL